MTIRVGLNTECKSRAERELFRMASLLSDDWFVWMNRNLNFETFFGFTCREVDCVIYHKHYGMLLIECKSGKVSTRYNEELKRTEWFQAEHLLDKSPVEQVRSLISPFHDYMKYLLKAPFPKEFYRVRVQWALCFSDMDTMEGIPRAECSRKRVFLRPDLLDVKKFEKCLIDILEIPERSFNNLPYPNETLDEEAFFALQDFLDGNGDRPSTGEILKENDSFVEQASDVQCMLMDSISENLRVRIKGVAGSGKSHMVLWEALRLSRIGKSVAIACYNDLLASELLFSVKRELEKEMLNVKAKYGKDGGISFGRIDVLPYSKWCEKYVKTAKLKLDKGISRGEYYDKILPQGFCRAEKVLRKDKKAREKFFYDAVIIDEGQDFASDWVDSLVNLLRVPEKGFIRFFYDPAQRLYGSRNGEENAQVLSMPVMVLSRGFRNTKRILEWVYKKTGFSLAHYNNLPQGPAVKENFYSNAEDLESLVVKEYENLIRKFNLLASEVLVVSMRAKGNSLLKNFKDDRFVWNDVGTKSLIKDKVNIVSSHRIKGLDARAVFLIDVEEPIEISDRGDWKRRLLVGATRAKQILTVFYKK